MKDGKPWRVRKAEREAAQQSRLTEHPPVTPPPDPKYRVPNDHNPHFPRGVVPWKPDKVWDGETVCIIGGGPSLIGYDLSPVREKRGHNLCRVIAVNNAYKIAPWADILHFADAEWWAWNRPSIQAARFAGIITTATSDTGVVTLKEDVKRFWRDRNKFTTDNRKLHGWDSGTQATNLAFHLGAKRIVLFGFDMMPAANGQAQWHKDHKRATRLENYQLKFAPHLAEAIREMAKLGVTVVRATNPGIPEAPYVPLPEALEAVIPV